AIGPAQLEPSGLARADHGARAHDPSFGAVEAEQRRERSPARAPRDLRRVGKRAGRERVDARGVERDALGAVRRVRRVGESLEEQLERVRRRGRRRLGECRPRESERERDREEAPHFLASAKTASSIPWLIFQSYWLTTKSMVSPIGSFAILPMNL